MSLTAAERERAREHLGYPAAQSAAAIQLGIGKPTQTLFLVDQALDLLLPAGEERVRSILTTMDEIECRLRGATSRLSAESINGLHLRADECDRLDAEYTRWGWRLSDQLGAPPYPYSPRYMGGQSGQACNVCVRRG